MRRIVTVALLLIGTTAPLALSGCSSDVAPPPAEQGASMQKHWQKKMPGKVGNTQPRK